MATKSILLAVTDPQVLIDIHQALGAGWEASSVASEAEALAQLETRTFDALLVDFNLGSPDASELLNQALEKRPETIRFLLAHEADLALVAAKVLGSHQILPKPIESASLKSRIENGVNDSDSIQHESAPDVVESPTIPSIYNEVLQALDSAGVTNEQVGEIIARDAALTSEVLRLAKSAYMGLPGNLTDPAEAVESLGLDTVKALVLALRFFAEHSRLKTCYLSLEQLWEHSTRVAQIARDLVLFETKDRTLASQAFAAGLLHDLGKVVLVTNFEDLYGRVHSLARKQPVPLWEVEKEMFGANHGEVGACLVGMWNLPAAIVEATALHHEPPLGEHENLTPLAAIHIANVLEHELRTVDDYRVAPIINTAFLNQLGLLQRLPVWRARSANRGLANQNSTVGPVGADESELANPELESSSSSLAANQLPAFAAATRTSTSGLSRDDSRESVFSHFWNRRWSYGGFTAGLLLLLAFWLRTQSKPDESAPVYARTPVISPAAVEVSSTPVTEPDPVAGPEVAFPAATLEAPPGTNSLSVTNEVVSQPPPESTQVLADPVTVSNASPILPPKESVLPDFRLNGIIYTVAHPSAILNGEAVHIGDRVSGATVISITPTDVVLRINGVRRTFSLR